MPVLAEVAVPVPLGHAFTYEVPAALSPALRPGARVLVPFGSRKVVGVVLRAGESTPPEGVALKSILGLVDAEPVLPEELLAFLREVAEYYFAPVGEVLRLALPAGERGAIEKLDTTGDLFERLKGSKKVAEASELAVTPVPGVTANTRLRGQAKDILARLAAEGPEAIVEIERSFSNARAAVKRLEGLGLVTIARRPKSHALFSKGREEDGPVELTGHQRGAADAIIRALGESGTEKAFLLHGVTGSGKTEVYFHAIHACLTSGRGALVMVPEIALTPQLVSRFRARFGDDVAVLHSGLTDPERHRMWKLLHSRTVRVAIGARSAVFAPVPSLGLIVVDEEHDSSFKQEEGVRYHARDMALLRARRAGATIILGSATPSLESVALVARNKLIRLALPDRAHSAAALPKVEVVDVRRIGPGPTGEALISLPLHRAIDAALEKKEQVILFLNRRGFAPSVVCMACGSLETCKACSVSLTFHRLRGRERVRCHYCGYEGALPTHCASCNAAGLSLEGLGTEKLEEILADAFPRARVARLDRDTAAGAKAEGVLDRMRRGEIDLLVGTQMVTKGHDLPNVTLVGVINADAALSMPDFRASERTFQLLVQVAGRAGRHDRPGRVLIQTRTPKHPAIRFAALHDVSGFLDQELADREEAHYPPAARLALIRVDAIDEKVALHVSQRIADHARTTEQVRERTVEIMGPAPAPLARLRGRYRYRVLLRAAERPPLRQVLHVLAREIPHLDRRARTVIDVDPVSML